MTIRRDRRYSTDFRIQLVQAYLDGEGSVRAVAGRHGVGHSLLGIWIQKYDAGELKDEVHLREQVGEYEAKIASLERKAGQPTMELDVTKKRALTPPQATDVPRSIIFGPCIPIQRGCRLMNLPRSTIGYATSHLLDTRQCLAALDAALELRGPTAGLVHHSDRGVLPGRTVSASNSAASKARCAGRAIPTTTPRSRASSRR